MLSVANEGQPTRVHNQLLQRKWLEQVTNFKILILTLQVFKLWKQLVHITNSDQVDSKSAHLLGSKFPKTIYAKQISNWLFESSSYSA